jgi:hypothetical protein
MGFGHRVYKNWDPGAKIIKIPKITSGSQVFFNEHPRKVSGCTPTRVRRSKLGK